MFFLNKLFPSTKKKVLLLGPDYAGKTTLLEMLKNDILVVPKPNIHPRAEQVTMKGVELFLYDLGDHGHPRRVWHDYFPGVDGIVYMVDSTDVERFQEIRAELRELFLIEKIRNVPFLILGNKTDARGSVCREKLYNDLGLEEVNDERPIELFMCSIVLRQGYVDAFHWFIEHMRLVSQGNVLMATKRTSCFN